MSGSNDPQRGGPERRPWLAVAVVLAVVLGVLLAMAVFNALT